MSRRKLTPTAQRPLTAISKRGEMIKFGQQPPPPTPSAPVIGTVTISPDGNQVIGTVFTCNWTLSSGYPYPTAAYQWMADAVDIVGATNQTFDSTGRSEAEVITCKVTLTNSEGSDGPTTSSNSATLTAVPLDPPVNTVAPTISPSGAQDIGTVFTADEGTWTGAPTIVYTYQWKADAGNIAGATNKTFDSTGRSGGEVITCDVTGTNGDGSSTAGSSNSATLNAVPASDRATELLSSESDGLAIAFVDDSMLVKEAGAGTSTDILTGGVVAQSTTPEKIIRYSNGILTQSPANVIDDGVESDDPTTWTGTAATVTPINGPQGANTAGRYNCGDNAGSNLLFSNSQADLFDSGRSRLFKIKAKYVDQQWICVAFTDINGGSANRTRTWFDVQNGVVGSTGDVGSGSARTVSITLNADGWWDIYYDFSMGAGTDNSIRCAIFHAQADNSTLRPINTETDFAMPQIAWRYTNVYLPSPTGHISCPLPIDHDINGNSLGVLNEPEATNIRLDSGDLSQNAIPGLTDDGLGTGVDSDARLFTENTSPGQHWTYNTTAGVTDAEHTWSQYVKPNGGLVWCYMQFATGASADGGRVFFNLSTPAVGTIVNLGGAVNTSGTITDIGNGYYRLTVTTTSNQAATHYGSIGTATSDGNISHTGDGTRGFYLKMPQIELGAIATSPIITAGSQVTRDADAYNGDDLFPVAWPWPAAALTAYGAGTPKPSPAGNEALAVQAINQVYVRWQENTAGVDTRLISRGGSDVRSTSTHPVNTEAKHAAAWTRDATPTDVITSYNGSTGDSGSFTSNSLGSTQVFRMGRDNASGQQLHGHMKEVVIIPRKLTQTELNTLTTP